MNPDNNLMCEESASVNVYGAESSSAGELATLNRAECSSAGESATVNRAE